DRRAAARDVLDVQGAARQRPQRERERQRPSYRVDMPNENARLAVASEPRPRVPVPQPLAKLHKPKRLVVGRRRRHWHAGTGDGQPLAHRGPTATTRGTMKFTAYPVYTQ